MTQNSKFLVIQTASAGDVVLASPLIECIYHFFPEAKIDFLLKKGNDGLFQNHPFLNEVIVFDKNNKILNLIKLLFKIRKRKYHVVICIQRFFSAGLLTAFSGSQKKYGFSKNPFSYFFTHSFPHQIENNNQLIHEIDRNLSLLNHICPEKRFLPKLYPNYNIEPKEYGLNTNFITISPASLWFTKQFPAAKWVELISLIPDSFQVAMLGSNSDVDLCNQIKKEFNDSKIIVLAGKLNMLESAALMKKATINFTNDSAPMHLASAVNAAVCAVFCSTVPDFGFVPLSEKSVVIQTQESLACRPCGLHGHQSCPEKHFRCAEIKVVEIISKCW